MIKLATILYPALVVWLFSSCTVSKIYPKKFYEEHKVLLHQTEELYYQTTKAKQIAIAFTDLDFTSVSLELKTDTVKYIYDFDLGETRIADTLIKFGYDPVLVNQMITNMKGMRSTWINTLDYYVDGRKQLLLFISVPVKQFSLLPLLQKRKYYMFNFYNQPQAFDEDGLLLDKKRIRQVRKVKGQTFRRINDKVSYTVSGKFR